MTGLILVIAAALLAADPPPETAVGLSGRMTGLVLPGPELDVKPNTDRRTPLIVRILQVWPHGTAFRYDIEYYGLEPGTFDVKDYLQRKDGSVAADLPAIPVTIHSVLPPGQIKPNPVGAVETPNVGGYRTFLIAAGVVWVVGLGVILFAGRRKPKAADETLDRPRTLAEYLRPLVEGAMAGRLGPAQLAALERTLLVYWERRLHLEHKKPAEAIADLRRHPEAGPLFQELELWLHSPAKDRKVDVAALLEPYRNVPAESLTEEAGAA